MEAKMVYGKDDNWTEKGRRSRREDISQYQVRQIAEKTVRDRKGSPQLIALIETLAVGGVLTGGQIERSMGIKMRSIQRYQQNHYLDRIPMADPRLRDIFPDADSEALRVYRLGRAGWETARLLQNGDKSQISGVVRGRILHDLCVGEVVLMLGTVATEDGWDVSWVSRRGSVVRNEENYPLLEPDALIKMTRSGANGEVERRAYAVEYMAEDFGFRASDKVVKYDNIYRGGHWMKSWGLRDMPPVLAVFWHKAVGKAFYEYFDANRSVTTTRFYAKSWADLHHPDEDEPVGKWYCLNRLDFETLFEEPKSPFPPPTQGGAQAGSDPGSATQTPPATHGW